MKSLRIAVASVSLIAVTALAGCAPNTIEDGSGPSDESSTSDSGTYKAKEVKPNVGEGIPYTGLYEVEVTLEDGTKVTCLNTQQGRGSGLDCDWGTAQHPDSEKDNK